MTVIFEIGVIFMITVICVSLENLFIFLSIFMIRMNIFMNTNF